MNRLKIFLLLVFLPGFIFSQSKKIREAERAFAQKEYYQAADLYKKAYAELERAEDKATVIFKVGLCYRLIGDFKSAEAFFAKAIKARYPDPEVLFLLADSKKSLGKYEEAIVEFTNFKKEMPGDQRGENGIRSCELAVKWMADSSKYVVENMAPINSKSADFAPAFKDDNHLTLLFTSTREGCMGSGTDNGMGQLFSDLFETTLDKNSKWSLPLPLPPPVSTKDNEGSASMDLRSGLLYFTRCVRESKKERHCNIQVSAKQGTQWAAEVTLPFCSDSFHYGQPAVSPDGYTIYFSSNMRGGYGGLDIWMSTYDTRTKAFSPPRNLGPDINSSGAENFPSLSSDGNTLYFSSDTHPGMGSLDIFKSEYLDGTWGKPANLQFPINSAGDDFGIIFDKGNERGYFSSNRSGGKGGDDIYSFTLSR